MDLYFQAAAVLVAGAALAYLIYVMMTPAQMFAPMIEDVNAKIEARLDTATRLDVSSFSNGVDVPGTAVLSLIQDASSNKLAVFVQTRAQKGLVVNYGYQMRSSQGTRARLGIYGSVSATATEFEINSVTTVRQLFGAGIAANNTADARRQMGSDATSGALLNGQTSTGYYTARTTGTATPLLMGTDGLPSTMDPLIQLWDPFESTYLSAQAKKRNYSATGWFYTPCILRTNIATNDNTSFAETKGSVYYISVTANYYTTYIVDAAGTIIGIYVEEHGCDPNGSILAAAMASAGYIAAIF